MPGETGLSPYQIVFGRERFLAGIPMQPPRVCEEAAQFFDRIEKRDKELSIRLTEKHWQEMARENVGRLERPHLGVGDWV